MYEQSSLDQDSHKDIGRTGLSWPVLLGDKLCQQVYYMYTSDIYGVLWNSQPFGISPTLLSSQERTVDFGIAPQANLWLRSVMLMQLLQAVEVAH